MPRILFITPNPVESASDRYRIYQFLPYFERAGYSCTVRPFANPALYRAIQRGCLVPKLFYTPFCYLRRVLETAINSDYDAVVVHRGIFPFPWPMMERVFLRQHAKVVFDFDDAIHIGHRDIAAAKYGWIYKLKYGPRVNGIMRKCAHIIAGNRTLAEHALQFHSQVSIIPTVVDLDRYRYLPPHPANDTLTIGWVGSRSTSPYLLDVEPALRRLSEVHGSKVRFRFYGDPQRRLNLPNCESLPFSLRSEIDNLRTIDIGIMPVPDNEWTRGKCAFKAIQFMALGIPAVVSPVGMASEVVQHRVNGLFARTPQEWFDGLNDLIGHTQLLQQFAEEGRRTVQAHYSLQMWAPRLINLLDNILTDSATAMDDITSAAAD